MKDAVLDKKTADAFTSSWNNLPQGTVYTFAQFKDWVAPLTEKDVSGKRVLELGCGNASQMVHMANWNPSYLEGVELGDSVISARANMAKLNFRDYKVIQADLTDYQSDGFDLVYCIGVLHHLASPKKGFEAILRNTRSGGRFHAWVYAREGNAFIIYFIDPIRKIV